MAQKCVIVRRDEQGFGLRVSGDNPVTVDYVKPDGAAWKAGLRAGQVIVKVNGTLVMKQSHLNVVQMIKQCPQHVALTVQDILPTSCPTSPSESPPPQGFLTTASSTGGGITRSESLKQRRENKPSYRKRSDPALPSSGSASLNTSNNGSNRLNQIASESSSLLSSSDDERDDDDLEANEEECSFSAPTHPPPPTPLLAVNHLSCIPPPLPPRNQIRCKSSKRQEIIKELFDTEKTHVDYLRVLHTIFYQPIKEAQLLSPDQLEQIFSSHDRLWDIHTRINDRFQKKAEKFENLIQQQLQFPQQFSTPITEMHVGSLLVEIFDGPLGRELEHAASIFCASQTTGLDILNKLKIKKDSKFVAFLTEAEAQEACKRLDLKAILACCFQRLTKYPLLLDNLLKATNRDIEDYELIECALKRTREILHVINESKRMAENRQRMRNIQRKIEKQSNVNLDLTEKVLVYEGSLTWRITKQKCIDVLVVLCTDILIILSRDNDRLTLKNHTNPINKNTHSPILKVNDLFTRNVATDKTAFFLVSTNENAVYEFAAISSSEKDTWIHKIQEISCTNKFYLDQGRSLSKLIDLTSPKISEIEEDVNKEDNSVDKMERIIEDSSLSETGRRSRKDRHEGYQSKTRIEGTISYVTDEEMPLISPNALQVVDLASHERIEEAVRIVTPEEKLHQIDIKLSQLLNEKINLIQEILRIKDQKEWNIINDQQDRASSTLILSLMQKTMKLASSLTLNGPFIKSLNNQEVVSLENNMEDFLTKLNISDNNLAHSLNKSVTDQLNNQSIEESKDDRLDLIIEDIRHEEKQETQGSNKDNIGEENEDGSCIYF